MSAPRHGLAIAVTAGTVPYAVLKVSWLSGGDLGLRDPALMNTSTYMIANAITLALDVLVVIVAWLLAMSTSRWLVPLLAPMVWAATGLMITPVATAVLAASSGGLDEGRLAGDALHPWVYAVVYASFGVQAIGIASLFAVRVAKSVTWRRVHLAGPLDPSLALAAAAAGFAGVANLCVAAGVPLWPATASGLVRSTCWVTGSLCLWSGAGSVLLTRGRHVTAVVGVWVGTGAMVGWSSYSLLVRAVENRVDTASPALLALTASAGAFLTVVWIRRLVLLTKEARLDVADF
jgi:hypothetical protein